SRSTGDGIGFDGGNATKRWVDLKVTLDGDSINEINHSHTFKVTVQQDDGLPIGAPGGDASNGFGNVVDGTSVTFSLPTNTAGASITSTNPTTTSGGTASVTILD